VSSNQKELIHKVSKAQYAESEIRNRIFAQEVKKQFPQLKITKY